MTGDTQLFAVIRARGPSWQASQPLDGQADWGGHATFMNALAMDGFVLLGGPLEGTSDVLLIIRAESPEVIRARLAEDPWTANDLLRIARITPWTLRLGSLGRPASFETKRLPSPRDVMAPDGSDVRVLLGLARGGMAHFSLPSGRTSTAVTHRTVEEIWFVVSGRGEMWRASAEGEEIVPLEAGVCLTIPLGTHFQFRSTGSEALAAVAVTMPPWPGDGEAVVVQGKWTPTAP